MRSCLHPLAVSVQASRRALLALALLSACSDPAPVPFQTRAVVGPRMAEALENAGGKESLDFMMAEVMVNQIQASTDSAMRSKLAHDLSELEEDWVVPSLLARLIYERSEYTRLELARTLAHYKNWAGLDSLYVIASDGGNEQVRAAATRTLEELAAEAQVADSDTLWRLWNHGDMDEQLPFTEPSLKHRLEIWKRIAQLAGESYEDAIFALSNSQAWVAAPLAAALHEEDKRIAKRAATCLRGLGARGTIAGPDLVLALEAPWIATEAAAALGRVAYPAAGSALERCLVPERKLELRIQAARSLGQLGLPDTVPALKQILVETEPLALRCVAAAALVRMNSDESTVRAAAQLLRSGGDSTMELEDALGVWLERRAQSGGEASSSALKRWNKPITPPGLKPTPEELTARLGGRADAIQSVLDGSAQE